MDLRKHLQGWALVLCLCLIGCTALESAPPTSSLLPVTGGVGTFEIHEYALVEESKDNPNHVAFQQRVPAAVASQQGGWPFSNNGDVLRAANQALAPFGYSLAGNPTPPFSAYALSHNGKLVQRDIARFSPVALKNNANEPGGMDFLFSFETMDGEKLTATMAGIHSLKADDESVGGSGTGFSNQKMAFAGSLGSEALIFAGADTSMKNGQTGAAQSGVQNIPPGGFGSQTINGQHFSFYSSGDLVYLNYAGRKLPYSYDQVVYDNKGATAIFNPGGNGKIVWFYALRDGLWYYVEAGIFE